MKNIKLTRNPFILFLPFLVFYIAIVFLFPTNGTYGDEGRYLMFAHHIINGFYSTPAPKIDLGNGPGYPIILVPFVAFHFPLIFITLLNAILYYLSIILIFKTLQEITTVKATLIISLFWACYYNSYPYIPHILTETFASFLIPLIIFSIVKTFKQGNSNTSKKYKYLSGFTIGYLALTKLIFGYVILTMLVCMGILWLSKRSSANYRKGLSIFVIAFITTMPYLLYTYHITNRVFYWTSVGGDNLYWMSSPYKDESGSWSYPEQTENPFSSEIKEFIKLRHQNDFDEVFKHKGTLAQDDAFKTIVVKNIKSHPVKFIENCFSNVGRIIFNFPRSFEFQEPRTLLRLPLNGIIVVLMLFCFIPTIINWHKIIFPIRFLLFFALIYFGGSTLGSAETRMFTIIVPILLIWIAFVIQKIVKVNFAHWQNNTSQGANERIF